MEVGPVGGDRDGATEAFRDLGDGARWICDDGDDHGGVRPEQLREPGELGRRSCGARRIADREQLADVGREHVTATRLEDDPGLDQGLDRGLERRAVGTPELAEGTFERPGAPAAALDRIDERDRRGEIRRETGARGQ